MAKAVRGTKRQCRNCGSKFYDLARDPIVCPICQTVYELEMASPRAAAPGVKAPKEETAVVAASAAAVGAAELVSLDDVEETSVAAALDDDDIDLGDDKDAIPEGEDEDVFLEEDEEDETDVSGFIGGGVDDEER